MRLINSYSLSVLLGQATCTDGSPYHDTETPDISRRAPVHLQDRLCAPEDRCSDLVAIRGIRGGLRHRALQIRQPHIRYMPINWMMIHEDIAWLDI